jgi:hypothetical protein
VKKIQETAIYALVPGICIIIAGFVTFAISQTVSLVILGIGVACCIPWLVLNIPKFFKALFDQHRNYNKHQQEKMYVLSRPIERENKYIHGRLHY